VLLVIIIGRRKKRIEFSFVVKKKEIFRASKKILPRGLSWPQESIFLPSSFLPVVLKRRKE
jgi:hypothetical protein